MSKINIKPRYSSPQCQDRIKAQSRGPRVSYIFQLASYQVLTGVSPQLAIPRDGPSVFQCAY
jgi:hypothetical protein